MSTKFTLLPRAAAVAGILAIALPAFAQTNQPAATGANAPAVTATKPADKQVSGEVKIDHNKKHVEKDMTKVSEKAGTKRQPAETPAVKKPDAAVKSDAPATSK